jgi:hypothetical protein
VLFAGTQGRAVWFPGLFLPKKAKVHELACYHRKLTLGTLQTESLLALAGEVNAEIQRARGRSSHSLPCSLAFIASAGGKRP